VSAASLTRTIENALRTFNSLDAQREACEAITHDPVLPVLLETTVAEMRTESMGSATVLSRLADVLIARVIGAWAEDRPQDTTDGSRRLRLQNRQCNRG
jgi:hypothetical protein